MHLQAVFSSRSWDICQTLLNYVRHPRRDWIEKLTHSLKTYTFICLGVVEKTIVQSSLMDFIVLYLTSFLLNDFKLLSLCED